MIDFRVGIMGAGHIAEKIADTLNKMDQFAPYAIASRDIDKANEFGDKYNIEKRYGSYEELINDPDVELVYIATPHAFHAQQAKMCIEAGKPVLVEKAFSYNSETTAEVLNLSASKNVFCAEAMWMRYLPMYKMLRMYIDKGAIGKISNITCSLGYNLRDKDRITNPELAGGVLLDLGVYPLNLVSMLYGSDIVSISSNCAKLETGVDGQCTVHMSYKGARGANFFVTMMYQPDNNARIYGEYGYVEIDNFTNPDEFRIYQNDHTLIANVKISENQISGYEFEFLAARNAIIKGNLYSEDMTHEETLRIMKICDDLRKTWGVKFPMEAE